MSKKLKRISVILLVLSLVFLSACSGNKPSAVDKGEPGAKKADDSLYTIKLLVSPNQANITKSDQTPIGKYIKDKFHIVFELIPFSGNYRDKLNMMLAGGDYPELLRVERQDLVQKYIKAGAALPLDDYLKNSPSFSERYKNLIPYWRLASDDGKLYKWESSVPQDEKNFCECNDFAVRSDILEENGWPKLVSSDDYIQILKKGLAAHPQTNGKKTIGVVVPFAESWGVAGLAPILYEKGENIQAIGNEGVIFNAKENRFEHMLTNEYTKESIQFFNKLYREGLLDEESFTDTNNQVLEKVQTGQALGIFYTMWNVDSANKTLDQAGHPELEYVKLPIQSPTQVQRGEKRLLRLETTRPFDSVIITKNAKDPERIFKLIDWASSEEGQLLLQSGIKGVHYNVENGKRVPTQEFIDGVKNDPNYLVKQGFGLFGMLGRVSVSSDKDGQPYYLLNDVNVFDSIYQTDRIKEAYKKLGWENSKDWWYKNGKPTETGLASGIIIDPTSKLGMVHQKMVELRVKNTAKLIKAKSDEEFEALWKDLIDQYNKLDPQQVVDKYNELYQEQLKQLEKVKGK